MLYENPVHDVESCTQDVKNQLEYVEYLKMLQAFMEVTSYMEQYYNFVSNIYFWMKS